MSTLTQAQAQAPRVPHRIVVLTPSAFADDWAGKPAVDASIGLRLVSEQDIQTARAEAIRQAVGWYDDGEGGATDEEARTQAFNDALMRWIVARATTSPFDIREPYFEVAEETVRVALTSEGVRRLWDEYVLLAKGTGVATVPATDDEVRALTDHIAAGALAIAPDAVQLEVRKLLAYALSQIEPYAEVAAVLEPIYRLRSIG